MPTNDNDGWISDPTDSSALYLWVNGERYQRVDTLKWSARPDGRSSRPGWVAEIAIRRGLLPAVVESLSIGALPSTTQFRDLEYINWLGAEETVNIISIVRMPQFR